MASESSLNVSIPQDFYGLNQVPSSDALVKQWDDATWILTSAFIVFTMQSGFGLLESGSVSRKNEVNIMMKNAVDVLFGGLSYWMFGYGFSFGNDEGSNGFCGLGLFFVDAGPNDENFGHLYSHFFFQTSFATTATTIVSGALAERTKLEAYILFSFLNTLIYCFPAHWMWDKNSGWLAKLGAVDVAGAGTVHLVGGMTGLISTLMLGPRTGRFDHKEVPIMSSPTNAIFGLFMLWWGWLGFNCGSTYGITDNKWILAARSAVSTVTASIGGGVMGITLSYVSKRRKFDVVYIINGVLGALVGITSLCSLAKPWQGLVIGAIGGLIACLGGPLIEMLKIDDPVGVIPVHVMAAAWGLLAVGIFGEKDVLEETLRHNGIAYGGGLHILGVQAIAVLSIASWSIIVSFVILKLVDLTIGLRVPLHEELLGADLVEHSIYGSFDKSTREWFDLKGRLVLKIDISSEEGYRGCIKEMEGILKVYMSEIPPTANLTLSSSGRIENQEGCVSDESKYPTDGV